MCFTYVYLLICTYSYISKLPKQSTCCICTKLTWNRFDWINGHFILQRPILTEHFRSTGVLMGQQHVWTAGSHQQSCYCPSASQGALQGSVGGEGTRTPLSGVGVGLCVAALRWPAGLGHVRRTEPLPPAGWRWLCAARPALLRSTAGAEGRSRSKVT